MPMTEFVVCWDLFGIYLKPKEIRRICHAIERHFDAEPCLATRHVDKVRFEITLYGAEHENRDLGTEIKLVGRREVERIAPSVARLGSWKKTDPELYGR